MIDQNSILEKVASYAEKTLEKEISSDFVYHDLYHTTRVVKAAKMIGKESGLSEEELEIVTIAAWFHDLGYCFGCIKHEKASAKLALEFLRKEGYPEEKITKVEGCIMATQMPQSPKNLLEEVLCDADLHHLACSDYSVMSEKMHVEIEKIKGYEIKEEDWNSMNFNFFKDHRYFTNYGKQYLEPIKKQNLKSIKKKTKVSNKDDKYIKKLEEKIEKLEGKVALKPERGIETMFRTTSKNHLELSAMADNKANIMISVNTIIISVVVSVLVRKLYEYPNLVIPTMMLIVVCLVTIVLAILATRPNVSSGVFTDEDVLNKKTNLLFFGNFHKMKLDRYQWGMREMMKDGDYLYGSLTKDIYFLGVVLGKKYRLLRLCYTTFMIGFVLSILAFLCAMMFFPPQDIPSFYTF
ncbi:Pycsar system effector family protein [uncultured Roseivirga sp.]|uniref:Pycsar system effector family protein n=1 Tax=uncultured Roseivirga sp. TaxID=543088 RepID=UPI0030D9E5E1|tara:strand:+ start:1120 stop:2346 length:1227 start_codon:yes stop_codon:yes gene_type:complete